jgi:hypothetical protein
MPTGEKRTRCPNGTRKNKKTGKCEKKRSPVPVLNKPFKVTPFIKSRSSKVKRVTIKQSHKKKSKTADCPPHKPLFNRKTRRCVLDNPANRKKIKAINEELKEKNAIVPVSPPKYPDSPSKYTTNKKPIFQPAIRVYPKSGKLERLLTSTLVKPKIPVKSHGNYITFPQCSLKEVYENIDLNNIDFVGPTRSGSNYNDINKLRYKDPKTGKKIVLNNSKYISSGGYGSVYHVYDDSKTINLAMKQMTDYYDNEYSVIEKMQDKKVDCNVLSAKIIDFTPTERVGIYELYTGSLADLRGKLTIELCLQVLKNLVSDLLCLQRNGLSYTDLKPANILYKCLTKSSIKITLGDVGSICDNGGENPASYPPWSRRNTDPVYITCDDVTMVWGSGIIFLLLIINKKEIYYKFKELLHWDSIKKSNEKKTDAFLKEVYKYYGLQNVELNHGYTLEKLLSEMLKIGKTPSHLTLSRVFDIIN